MENIIYQRIGELCYKKGITISKLEKELGFGNSAINKWGRISSPSVDKILKIANYFDVSVDYILGRTDIESSVSSVIEDQDIISIQRAREKMQPKDRNRMMQMLYVGFDYAFSDQEDDDSKND